MLASLHGHDATQTFTFNCDGIKLEACRRLHVLKLCGPPGTRGASSDQNEPYDYDAEVVRAKIAFDRHYAEMEECNRILSRECPIMIRWAYEDEARPRLEGWRTETGSGCSMESAGCRKT